MKNFLFLLLLFNQPVFAEIYKWVDESGQVHYSDSKKDDQQAETINVNINSYKHATYEAPPKNNGNSTSSKKVTMYSTSWCGYCKKARKHFVASGIPFTEYDIEKDKQAKRKYDALGGTGVPVILVNNKRMNGFSVSGFNKIYQ